MPAESASLEVAVTLAGVSGLQALLTGVANSPVSWMTGHLLERETTQPDNDELGFHQFFHVDGDAATRRKILSDFVNVAALATATVWSMLVAAIILFALGVVAYQLDEGGWVLGCALTIIAVLIAVAVLLSKAGRGKVGRYPLDERGPREMGRLRLVVARYWQNLASPDTLTPYRTVALIANLFAVVVAAVLA
jgi:hypothetical protein